MMHRGKRNEESALTGLIHQVRRVCARNRSVVEDSEIRKLAIIAGRIRPVELGTGSQIVPSPKRGLEYLGARCRGAEQCNAPLKERWTEGHVLRPTDRSIKCTETLNAFTDSHSLIHEYELTVKP